MDSVSVVKNYYLERIKKLEAENQRLRGAIENSLNILPSCTANCKKPLERAISITSEGGA